jgi:1,4-dihydroxy-2-naphthoyl-CoA hydrolase
MGFVYTRTIRFADTDAAGVVYFARTLSLCHEAYEEALADAGMPVAELFSGAGVMIPIAKCEAEYFRPLRVGDKVRITARPERLTEHSFTVNFEILRSGSPEKIAARVRTEHVCTSPEKRGRTPLPAKLAAWVARG